MPEAADELEPQQDLPAPQPAEEIRRFAVHHAPDTRRPGPLSPSALPQSRRVPELVSTGTLGTGKHSEDCIFLMGVGRQPDKHMRTLLRQDAAAGQSAHAEGDADQRTRARGRSSLGARGWALLGQGNRTGRSHIPHTASCSIISGLANSQAQAPRKGADKM